MQLKHAMKVSAKTLSDMTLGGQFGPAIGNLILSICLHTIDAVKKHNPCLIPLQSTSKSAGDIMTFLQHPGLSSAQLMRNC